MSQRQRDLAAARDRLVAFLQQATGPTMTAAKAEELLRRAKAWSHAGARALDAHVSEHPDAFTAPSPHSPTCLPKLLRLLDAEGFDDAVVLLGCARCGKTHLDLPRNSPQGRCCERCMRTVVLHVCARCGRTATLGARREDGVICQSCYGKDPQRMTECARCGQLRIPKRRLPDGSAVCRTCSPWKRCAFCGEIRFIAARTDKGPACRSCYKPPPRLCGICGQMGTIHLRARDGRPDVCSRCRQNLGECVVCGKTRNGARVRGGEFHCLACWPRKHRPCSICGQTRRVCTTWPVGEVCDRCHHRRIHHPSACTHCGQDRVLVGARDSGPICASCCGVELDFTCRRCGSEGRILVRGTCIGCIAAERTTQLLSNQDGILTPQLRPLADAMAAANPATVISWLKAERSSQLIARLVAEDTEITHAALDALSQQHPTHYLRHVLVSTGILPRRNEPLARLMLWTEQTTAALPSHQQPILRPFAEWQIIRDARRRADRGTYREGGARGDRAQIRAAIAFLAWLDTTGTSIDTISQHHIDDYLATHPARQHVTIFLRWLKARHIGGGFDIPSRNYSSPNEFHDQDEQRRQLRKCLTDDTIPLDARVCGALIRLYGIPLVRILELTTDHFHHDTSGAYLTIGQHPVVLPPTLTRLIEQLITRHSATKAPTTSRRPAYLFPGRPASRPRDAQSMSTVLRHHSLPTRIARNTAMITIVGDLPTMVISDLLGLHPTTTQKWADYAQTSWADYLAHTQPPTTEPTTNTASTE